MLILISLWLGSKKSNQNLFPENTKKILERSIAININTCSSACKGYLKKIENRTLENKEQNSGIFHVSENNIFLWKYLSLWIPWFTLFWAEIKGKPLEY